MITIQKTDEDILLDSLATMTELLEQKNRKIDAQARTIKEMKRIMQENEVKCEECEQELYGDDLEVGMCTSCQRMMS